MIHGGISPLDRPLPLGQLVDLDPLKNIVLGLGDLLPDMAKKEILFRLVPPGGKAVRGARLENRAIEHFENIGDRQSGRFFGEPVSTVRPS